MQACPEEGAEGVISSFHRNYVCAASVIHPVLKVQWGSWSKSLRREKGGLQKRGKTLLSLKLRFPEALVQPF